MKHLFLVLSLFIMVSCDEPNTPRKTTTVTYGNNVPKAIEEIEIEGCQYIGSFNTSNTDWGTHKGNCTNPIHKQNHVTVIDTVEYQLIRK
jgi:hypothetical protein